MEKVSISQVRSGRWDGKTGGDEVHDAKGQDTVLKGGIQSKCQKYWEIPWVVNNLLRYWYEVCHLRLLNQPVPWGIILNCQRNSVDDLMDFQFVVPMSL